MTTVTHHKSESTPSDQAVAKAAVTVQVTDARGRVITMKRPAVLAQYRLIEALGETAKNDVYVAMALPLIYVIAIDDDSVIPPTHKMHVEALIQRLDEDGVNAVMTGVQEHFGQADVEGDKAAIKK